MLNIKIRNYSKLPNIILLLSAFINEHDDVALYFPHVKSLPQTILPYLQRMQCKAEILLSSNDVEQQLHHLNPAVFITEFSNDKSTQWLSENDCKDMLVIKILNCKNLFSYQEKPFFDIVKVENINSGENSQFELSQNSRTEKALQKLKCFDLVKVSIFQKSSDTH